MTTPQNTMTTTRGIASYTGSQRDLIPMPVNKAVASSYAMQGYLPQSSGYMMVSDRVLTNYQRLGVKFWPHAITPFEVPIDSGANRVEAEFWLDSGAMLARDWMLPEMIEEPSSSTATALSGPTVSKRETESPQLAKFTKAIRKDSLEAKQDISRTISLQQWECVVTEVLDDVVCCEMHDLSDECNPREYAEVYIAEFSEFDRPLLSEGTVFYWSVGHTRKRSGQIVRSSELRVRRMPKLTKSQKAQITRKVQKLNEIFGK